MFFRRFVQNLHQFFGGTNGFLDLCIQVSNTPNAGANEYGEHEEGGQVAHTHIALMNQSCTVPNNGGYGSKNTQYDE